MNGQKRSGRASKGLAEFDEGSHLAPEVVSAIRRTKPGQSLADTLARDYQREFEGRSARKWRELWRGKKKK